MQFPVIPFFLKFFHLCFSPFPYQNVPCLRTPMTSRYQIQFSILNSLPNWLNSHIWHSWLLLTHWYTFFSWFPGDHITGFSPCPGCFFSASFPDNLLFSLTSYYWYSLYIPDKRNTNWKKNVKQECAWHTQGQKGCQYDYSWISKLSNSETGGQRCRKRQK